MEALVRLIVTNRSFALLFFLIVALAAWIQLPQIRISQYPDVELPTLVVEVVLPGASAAEIEQRVVDLIEDKLQSTRDLEDFDSYVYSSRAAITIQFEYGVDIDDEYVDVNSGINNIKGDFPPETEVTVLKQSPVDLLVSFVLAVTSDTATRGELSLGADRVSERLRRIPSLEDVEAHPPEEEIRVDLDLARLEAANVDVGESERAIRASNQYLPTGTFTVGDRALSVLAFGSGYRSLEQIRDTMIINREGTALALRDLATVRRVLERDPVLAHLDGRPTVLVTAKLAEDANVFETRSSMAAALEDVPLGEDVSLVWLYDAEPGVAAKLRELSENILAGVAILALVLLFSVGLRSAFIITLTLPAALFLSLVGLSFTDYGIQEISLAGFIIALGLIVDNGIVVTENAFKLSHYRSMGHEEAAIVGTSAVVSPLLSSTATTALAFAPLYLLTSVTGLFLHSLVVVIWLCLASSLVAAIVISSFLIARIGTDNRVPFLPSPPSFLVALIPFRDRVYRRVLAWFIRHPLVLLAITAVLLAVAVTAGTRLPVILFPESEDPFFTVNVEAPRDRSSEALDALVRQLEAEVAAHPDVRSCGSVSGEAFPFVNTGIARVSTRRNNGQLFCTVPFRDAARLEALVGELNRQLDAHRALADIEASAFVVGGKGDIPDVRVELSGPRIERVREVAAAFEAHLGAADLPGAATVRNDGVSRFFAIDYTFRERVANALAVDRGSVDRVLALITHGREIDQFRDGSGDEVPIVLRAEADTEDPLNLLDRVYVTARTGGRVPLGQVIAMSYTEDEYDIEHGWFRPRVGIEVTAAPGASVEELTAAVRAEVEAFDLPDDFGHEIDGKVADRTAAFGGMGKYVGIITLVILAIFVFQFGSLAQPLIICLAIPLSFVGAFLLLWGTDQPMSFLAFIGLTSLMGIVINNSILLVDEGNQLLLDRPQDEVAEIAIEAGRSRFMPILLTSVTSIVGLLPLALGSTMFKALAIVVIGGLATSTFLTLLCIPVLYAYTTSRRARAARVTHDWDGQSGLGETGA